MDIRVAGAKEIAQGQAVPGNSDCPVIRTMKITHNLLDMNTGQTIEAGTQTVTQPCRTPLFGKQRDIGMCRSCENGWETDENYVERNGNG